VTAEVELIETNGKALLFKVSFRDDAGLIGEGIRQRAISNVARFMQRLHGKTNLSPKSQKRDL
jgi:fluoroacetyl-CoA thioesterase